MNKNVINLSALTLMVMGMTACGFKSGGDDVEYIPVQSTEDGAWHFINSKGEPVGTQQWEFEPTVTMDGIFTVRNDNGFAVMKWDGKEAKPIDSLQNLVSVGVYNEGLLPVTPYMQRIQIVDNKGDVKFTLEPKDGQEISSCSGMFQDGLLIVSTVDGKSGVVNTKGEWVVNPKYDEISEYNGGYALAAEFGEDYEDGITYFVLDTKGEAVRVDGKYDYPEGDCSSISQFENGVASVWSSVGDGEDYEYKEYQINTKGEVRMVSQDSSTWNQYLQNGDVITYTYSDGASSSKWTNTKGEIVMSVSEEGKSLSANGKYVTLWTQDNITIYSEDGKELAKYSGNYVAEWPGGDFGLVLTKYNDDYSSSERILLDKEGKTLNTSKLYGVGTYKSINFIGMGDEEMACDGYGVTSAYVDVTAAASKLATMITDGVSGKAYYYIGESVKDILEGQSVQYMSGKTFSIPTKEDTWQLATGAGFYVTGDINASANIVAPTYKEYFEVHHYDYWGTAWGWKRKKQVGVHVNGAAKVVSFDLMLHTNHPSGTVLRDALGRRLKKEGYTLVDSGDNYEVYSNNYREAIVYGTAESHGIGVLIGETKTLKLTNSEKAALAAKLY